MRKRKRVRSAGCRNVLWSEWWIWVSKDATKPGEGQRVSYTSEPHCQVNDALLPLNSVVN